MALDLSAHNMTALVGMYNDAATELGREHVKRFSDRKAAERRTTLIRNDLQLHRAARAGDITQSKVVEVAVAAKTADQNAAAAREAIAANVEKKPVPVADGPSLPVPSSNPAKDAEMPAVRRVTKPMNLAPKSKVFARREGSRQAILVDLLSRPQGATFGELYDGLVATGTPWKGVTIRSGLAWDINHIAGYGVQSELLNGEEFAEQGRLYEAQRLGMVFVDTEAQRAIPGPLYNPDMRLCVYHLTYPADMTAPLPHTSRPKKATAEQKAAATKALQDVVEAAKTKG